MTIVMIMFISQYGQQKLLLLEAYSNIDALNELVWSVLIWFTWPIFVIKVHDQWQLYFIITYYTKLTPSILSSFAKCDVLDRAFDVLDRAFWTNVHCTFRTPVVLYKLWNQNLNLSYCKASRTVSYVNLFLIWSNFILIIFFAF